MARRHVRGTSPGRREMSNRTAFLLLLAACLAAPVSIHAQGRTVTDDLTLIHGGRNRAETRQRFEFVLPRLVRACSGR